VLKRLLLATLASTALVSPALAFTIDFDCTATKVVDRKEFITKETFFGAARVITPEYRRISMSDDSGKETITYGVGGTDAKNWTLPVTKVGKDGEKDDGITAETTQPDKWGHERWLHIAPLGKEATIDRAFGFWTLIHYPDKTISAVVGTCKLALGQEDKLRDKFENKNSPPSQELRDPGRPESKATPKMWSVPIERMGSSITLDGMLNDLVPVRWMLDTGATISNIPYDIAVKLGAKVIREQKFEQADGTVVTSQVVIIKKVAIGGKVYVADIEASVTGSGTTPLLGKNYLDNFSSYEINNAQSHLVLRR
jgi:predicted aspartyl protease